MSTPPPPSTTMAAFAVACMGVALFSVMDAVIKGLSIAIGVYNTLLWRSFCGLLIAGTLYILARQPWPRGAVLRVHIWRAVVTTVMALLFFWAIAFLPLAEAIALSFIAPLIALYLAALLLGERIGRQAIVASILGLLGVGVILAGRFDGAAHTPNALLGVCAVLASAVLFAYNLVLARQQAQMAGPVEIVFFQNLTVFILLSSAAPWLALVPDAAHWPAIGTSAGLAVLSLLLLSWAYARAEAQILIPVEYTAFIWAALCGWWFFAEPLTWPVMGGTVLIVAGCLFAARVRPQPTQVEEIYA
ncbi:MAG: DMT family transporter [Sphingopyxis sp.]